MPQPRPEHVLEQVCQLIAGQEVVGLSDRELLGRFAAGRDEAAFEALVRRHGPMVLRLCRRWLRSWHDAEDVFQAVFLVLARKAHAIRKRESVGCWLHGVAFRLAAKVRARKTAGRLLSSAEEPAPDLLGDLVGREFRTGLDEELHRLPAKYRSPLVLHYLEGQTQEEAARQLSCSLSTLKRRLERGRELLRGRLVRRGLVPVVPFLVALRAQALAPAAVPPPLRSTTVRAAAAYATGGGVAKELISGQVALLAGGMLQTMFSTKLKIVTALLLVGVLGAGAAWLRHSAAAAGSLGETETITAPEEQPPEVYALLQLVKGQGEGDFELMKRTQAALIKSRLVLGEALRKPAVAKLPLVRQQRDPVAWLEKALRVDFPNDAEILRIGMSGYSPEQMATLVNGVAEAFLETLSKREKDGRVGRLDMLKQVYDVYDRKAREKTVALRAIQRAIAVSDPDRGISPLGQQVRVQELLDLKRELRRLRLEKAALHVQLGRRRGGDKSPLEEQLAICEEQEKLLRDEENQLRDRVEHLTADQIDAQSLQNEIAELDQFLKRLHAEMEQLRTELLSSGARATLLQKAEAPGVK